MTSASQAEGAVSNKGATPQHFCSGWFVLFSFPHKMFLTIRRFHGDDVKKERKQQEHIQSFSEKIGLRNNNCQNC